MENRSKDVFVCKKFGSNRPMKKRSVVLEGKEKELLALLRANVLLFFS